MTRSADSSVDEIYAILQPFIELEQWEEIEAATTAHAETYPQSAVAQFILSVAALKAGSLSRAKDHALQAHALDPNSRECADLLSAVFAMAGSINEAAYFAKLAVALPSSDSPWIVALAEKYVPSAGAEFYAMRETPLLKRAFASMLAGQWPAAETLFREHLAFHPGDREAHIGAAGCLIAMGQHLAALQSLRASLHSVPADIKLAEMLGETLYAVGDYGHGRVVYDWAAGLDRENAQIAGRALAARAADPGSEPVALSRDYAAWGQRFGSLGVAEGGAAREKDKLVVGYLLAGPSPDLVEAALASLLSRHDPLRYELVGFGLGELSDGHNGLYQHCFRYWHDVHGTDPYTLAAIVRGESPDILVDMAGMLAPEHARVLGDRLAPVQLAWRNMAYDPGLAELDGVLSDSVLDAGAAIQGRYLPLALGCEVGTLPPADLPMTAAADESNGLLLCLDAPLRHLNPETAQLVSRVLHRVPEARVLLRDYDFAVPEASRRLIDLFGNFGVAHRIEVVTVADDHSFFGQGHLALTPLPDAESCQKAINALWSGLPVVTLAGPGRHGRGTASLLAHAGFGEDCVVSDPDQAVDLAVRWLTDPERRQQYRDSVRDRLASSNPFNWADRARDLESVYERLWLQAISRA